MDQFQPSISEYAVLGVLAGGPAHGFAISKHLAAGSDLGRIITVRRPLVYRAMDRLVHAGLAESGPIEPGSAGPNRRVHLIMATGSTALNRWLNRPVAHVRDMRIEFQLKMALLERLGRSPLVLIRRQQDALAPTLAALDSISGSTDSLDLWRRHNAIAAGAYLESLEHIHSQD
jgi:PadR family transcriptional regulator AphA